MTIYVRTHGGLGNQLFQLSFGLEAAQINNTNLILDTSWFKNIPEKSTKRVEYLSSLCPNVSKTDDHDEIMLKLKFQANLFQKLGLTKSIIKEKYGTYDIRHLNHRHAYFDGYWHSYKYLQQNIISKQLVFTQPKTSLIKQYQEKILEKNSVMLHVRRGDYLQDTNKNIVLEKSYYDEAILYILKKEKNIELFIFSDDIEWVKNNWQFNVPTNYVTPDMEGDTSIHELELMSNCKHHIIANSTFSWWGAWLGNKAGQIVISPKNWLEDNQLITKNITPPSWAII